MNKREIKDQYPANRVQIETNESITENIAKLGLEIENEKNNEYTIKIDNEEQAHNLLNELVKDRKTINKFEITKPTDVLISIAILIVTILVIAKVTIKIYSNAILNYGTKMSLKDIIKVYKDKNN